MPTAPSSSTRFLVRILALLGFMFAVYLALAVAGMAAAHADESTPTDSVAALATVDPNTATSVTDATDAGKTDMGNKMDEATTATVPGSTDTTAVPLTEPVPVVTEPVPVVTDPVPVVTDPVPVVTDPVPVATPPVTPAKTVHPKTAAVAAPRIHAAPAVPGNAAQAQTFAAASTVTDWRDCSSPEAAAREGVESDAVPRSKPAHTGVTDMVGDGMPRSPGPAPFSPTGPASPSPALASTSGCDSGHARNGSGADSVNGLLELTSLDTPDLIASSNVVDEAITAVSQSQGVTERPD